MAQTVAGLTPLLKEVYHPKMYKVINESDPTLTEIKRRFTAADMDGSAYVWPLHTGRSTSGRFMAEQGTLPTADRQRTARASADAFQVAHTIEVTKKSIDRSKGNAGSYRGSLPFEIEGAVADMKNRLCRVIYGQGSAETATPTTLRTGKIARVDAKVGNVLTLGESGTNLLTEGEMRYFFVNQSLSSITPGTGAVTDAAVTITAVNIGASQITVDDATAVLVGDILVEGDANGNAYNLEFPGLRVLVNNNAGDQYNGANTVLIHGVSSATNPAWQSQVVSGPISDALLVEGYRKIATDGDGAADGANVVIGSWEQHDELANQLIALRRYDGRDMTMQTGWQALKLSQGNFIPTRYCPTNNAFRLNPSRFAWLEAAPLDWDTEDNGDILLRSQTTLSYLARYVGDMGMVVLSRNSHSRYNFDAIA